MRAPFLSKTFSAFSTTFSADLAGVFPAGVAVGIGSDPFVVMRCRHRTWVRPSPVAADGPNQYLTGSLYAKSSAGAMDGVKGITAAASLPSAPLDIRAVTA